MAAIGKKKLVIKPFKVQPKLPENFEANTWNKLKVGRQAVRVVAVSSVSSFLSFRKVEFAHVM